ncbi:MAG TPA: hypothetical protein VFF59_04845 [Anaerolineae bacterium]|nr:hypothetical protein [Anaerolineae bacterium]
MSDQAIQRSLDVQRAQDVKRLHEADLLRKPNVVAVGIGYRTRGGQRTEDVCIVVSVKTKVPAAQLKRGEALPASIDGVPIDVVETGVIRAQ